MDAVHSLNNIFKFHQTRNSSFVFKRRIFCIVESLLVARTAKLAGLISLRMEPHFSFPERSKHIENVCFLFPLIVCSFIIAHAVPLCRGNA